MSRTGRGPIGLNAGLSRRDASVPLVIESFATTLDPWTRRGLGADSRIDLVVMLGPSASHYGPYGITPRLPVEP